MGKTGRGKTHLAVSIAYRAIQNGFTAKFTTASALIDELSRAGRDGDLRQALRAYTSPHVLVIDEVGYLTYGNDAANVLFHVVNDRHIKMRPIIFTTNKSPFADWGDVLHDRDLADAIVDRTLERGRIILLDGPSARTRHIAQDTGGGNIEEPVIISGIDRSYFPEPTALVFRKVDPVTSLMSLDCHVGGMPPTGIYRFWWLGLCGLALMGEKCGKLISWV